MVCTLCVVLCIHWAPPSGIHTTALRVQIPYTKSMVQLRITRVRTVGIIIHVQRHVCVCKVLAVQLCSAMDATSGDCSFVCLAVAWSH